MIAILSRTETSMTVCRRRQIQLKPALVAIGYQLRMLICFASRKIERHFAAFANVPCPDPLSRQHWEQLWKMDYPLLDDGANTHRGIENESRPRQS